MDRWDLDIGGLHWRGEVGINSDVTEAVIEYSSENVGEDRDRSTQPMFGKWGNDERGHIVAKALGGAWEPMNITSQSRAVNRGPVLAFENQIRKTLTAHRDWQAHLHVSARYQTPDLDSPTHRTAEYYRPYEFRYSVSYTNPQGNKMSRATRTMTVSNGYLGPF